MSLPLAIHQARYPARRGWLRRWLPVALITVAVPMAISRSAIVALALTGIMLIPSWPKAERRRAYLLLLPWPFLLWLASPGLLASFTAIFVHLVTDSSTTSRANAIPAAAAMIAQHPWLGQGFQTFFPQSHFFVDDQFITSLIETGFAGF